MDSHRDIIARSESMRAALAAARQAAGLHGGVLICGESGSGRRMVAREVHRLSSGSAAPFVAADCGEVDEIEAVLFGVPPAHGNGDGGPQRDRVSKLSLLYQAVGGTLFLAHLTDMPARVQARLARVLRDGEVTVAESRRTVPTRMRLFASSDASWDGAVADGQIRADLSKRCSQTRILVPPLRDRREDIPELAGALLGDVCAEAGVGACAIDEPAMSLLCAFPWHGNVTELRALLRTLVGRANGPLVRLQDVLASVHLDGAARSFPGGGTLREAKERFEREYILAVLERHRGRVGEAARALGIQRPNLYRKMRALRVSPPRTGVV
jgi:DNA-binding NtrC family response regulator